jgi:hypothetical protein
MAYRSLVSQTLHYLARPHDSRPSGPVRHPAAWRASDLDEQCWRQVLTEAEVEELDQALAFAKATGKPIRALNEEDFPLPTLTPRIHDWRVAVQHGRGFQVVRGVPVHRWSKRDAEIFFWCFGLHMGTPGAQNPQGDLVGHVLDQRSEDAASVRGYRTSEDLSFHCDAADLVGLLCLQPATFGGASRLASSVSVFNTLRARSPDLAARLFEPIAFDTHSEGGLRWFPVTPCRFFRGELRTMYHGDYFRSAPRHAEVPTLGRIEQELLHTYDAIASDEDHCLEMAFEQGDIQLVSNHTIIHARTAYREQPHARRHLLRLWVSLPQAYTTSMGHRARTLSSKVALSARMGLERVRQKRIA